MKLEHANITVRSIEEAERFLGAAFPDFRRRGGGFMHGDEALGDWVHFGNDETYLALQQNRSPSPADRTAYASEGVNHLGFTVNDLESLMARLSEAGYALSPASALDAHPHRRRAYYFDGNGFEWEFVEYLSDNVAERNQYDDR